MSRAYELSKRLIIEHKEILFSVLCGCILMYIYCSNIQNICTVWELGDEAGYLCNAAYFAGVDWSDVASRLPYYGYGYSILLIPLFWICKNGVSLIQGAVFVNCVCVLIAYCLQIAIMNKLFDKCNKLLFPVFASIISLQSFIVASVFKVLCEVNLIMWIWLIGYILIVTMEKKSNLKFCVLGMVSCFIFFIHTRAIVVLGTVGLIMLWFLIIKKISVKEFCFFVFPLVMAFVAFYFVKNSIMYDSMNVVTGDERESINMLSGNYILVRLRWLLTDFSNYIISFAAKILYLIYSSCGMILFGVMGCVKGIKKYWQESDDITFSFYLYAVGVAMLMVLACTVNGIGTSGPAYFFYSRYYEYAVSPIILLGFYEIMVGDETQKDALWFIAIIGGVSSVTWLASTFNLLQSERVAVDTARFPGFTAAILKNSNFRTLVTYVAISSILFILVYLCLRKTKKLRFLITIIIGIIIIRNSDFCLNAILENNDSAYGDVRVADFMMNNTNEEEVIFVDSDYVWRYYYARMQVLMKNKKLIVLNEADVDAIESGKYYLSYLTTDLGERLIEEGKLVEQGSVFGVFVN